MKQYSIGAYSNNGFLDNVTRDEGAHSEGCLPEMGGWGDPRKLGCSLGSVKVLERPRTRDCS